jgi:uncharacterized membrane protein YkoI
MRALLSVAALGLVGSLGVMALAEEVPLDKVPKAALDAVKAKFPGAKLTGAEKEKEDGKVVYEIALTLKDQKIEVHVTPEGKITEIEREIKYEDLPKAVTDAFKAKYTKAKVELVEEVTKDDKISYELHIALGKRKMELVYDPTGKLLKEEKVKKEEKKEE